MHDLHHIATGYDTSWTGEGEIAAWELASGCGEYAAAWFLNFAAFLIGSVIAPVRVWRAFRLGRSCSSLYSVSWDERWLNRTVSGLRQQLGIDKPLRTDVRVDALLFAACAIPGALVVAGLVAIAVAL